MIEKINNLPNLPGCYLMKNKLDIVIYVGKANNLKKRVKSYYNKSVTDKTKKLVNETEDLEYMVLENETEALILELNLIKKYNPKYNILMRDDKTYPYIEFLVEKVPRLKIVRRLDKKKSKNLYGPFPNVDAARKTVKILNRLYPLRKCNNYAKTPCLYYHLGQCLGYCKYQVGENEINKMVKEITSFLMGNKEIITKKINLEIKAASLNQNYEKALELKEILSDIDTTLIKQVVEIKSDFNGDVFGHAIVNNYLAVFMLFVRNGKIVGTHQSFIEIIDEVNNEMVRYIANFYEKNLLPKNILIDFDGKEILENYLTLNVLRPQRGEKRQLIALAQKNANEYLEKQVKLLAVKNKEQQVILEKLKSIVGEIEISRIEVYDISTIMGNYTVAGMIVYQAGKFFKKEYRKFKITDIHNDFLGMKEVIARRYQKVVDEKLEKADLILVDGGIIQVTAAKEALKDLGLNILVLGIQKDEKHQTSKLIFDQEYQLDKKDLLYTFMAKLQDEVHRFTLNYHQQLRSKASLKSILDEIPLIGEKTKMKLFDEFKTIEGIKKANDEELRKIVSEKALDNLRKVLGDIDG